MTFGQYLQNLGVLLAQWLPVAILFYVAVRKGYQDGARDANVFRAVKGPYVDPADRQSQL